MALEPVRARVVAAMVRRDFSIARSYRMAFVLDSVFGVLNLVVFYYISRAVTPRGTDLSGASTYFDFAAIGLAMTLVLQATTTQLGARIHQEQMTGTLEALWTQPVSAFELSLGLAGFPFLFATLRAAVYLMLAAMLLGLEVGNANWPGLLLMLIVSGVAVGAIGIVVAAAVFAFKRGEGLAALFTFSLGLLGGALFPVEVFPSWLKPLAAIVPTRFAFDGIRTAVFEGSGWSGDFLSLLIFAACAIPLSLWVFRVALRHSLKTGSLGEY
ncbi:MAG TPA: ABC transporter permease [Actinomycetota bacterium]|nr:ABC transporter permease [Actinomycetota bacterium]